MDIKRRRESDVRLTPCLQSLLRHTTVRARMISRRSPLTPPADVNLAHLRDLWRLQAGRCALSGIPMTHTTRPQDPHGRNVSLDRIASALNYTRGNVQLVCQDLNRMKHSLGEGDFEDYCAAVVLRRQSRRRRMSI